MASGVPSGLKRFDRKSHRPDCDQQFQYIAAQALDFQDRGPFSRSRHPWFWDLMAKWLRLFEVHSKDDSGSPCISSFTSFCKAGSRSG